jgi:hypothetical protein
VNIVVVGIAEIVALAVIVAILFYRPIRNAFEKWRSLDDQGDKGDGKEDE